jgi:hypothetical protein
MNGSYYRFMGKILGPEKTMDNMAFRLNSHMDMLYDIRGYVEWPDEIEEEEE